MNEDHQSLSTQYQAYTTGQRVISQFLVVVSTGATSRLILFLTRFPYKLRIIEYMHYQVEITLAPRPRGFHLISADIINAMPELSNISVGILHVFIQHTSAALSINENTDPAVLRDFEVFFNRLIPEDSAPYEHTYEGSDDLPAHFKSSVLGASISIPVTHGRLNLGTWQGIYLCEHRNHGGSRRLVLTLHGK